MKILSCFRSNVNKNLKLVKAEKKVFFKKFPLGGAEIDLRKALNSKYDSSMYNVIFNI